MSILFAHIEKIAFVFNCFGIFSSWLVHRFNNRGFDWSSRPRTFVIDSTGLGLIPSLVPKADCDRSEASVKGMEPIPVMIGYGHYYVLITRYF